MKTWQLWSGVLVIFLAGILIGAAGTGIFLRHSIENIIQGGPPEIAHLVSKRLTRQLDLSTDQQAKVDSVIRDTQRQLMELRRTVQPQTAAIIRNGAEQIRTELDAGQQQEFDQLLERLKARWQTAMIEPQNSGGQIK